MKGLLKAVEPQTEVKDPTSNAAQELLVVSDVHKNYGAGQELAVLGGITFSVRKGEFVSVVGPSGCGKTTLLLALCGLLRPDRGSVAFDGELIGDGTPAGVAIVFQDYSRSLFPWKTVLTNVMFGMRRLSGISGNDKAARARELLAAVGLDGFEDRYPWQLSGGMQQRVAIARGLASRSKLLLLDERSRPWMRRRVPTCRICFSTLPNGSNRHAFS